MAASQAVSTTGLDEIANTSNKKSGKKGVSKKDLRRVDELLKSTLDALVSIKHEPEVHVDQETPSVAEQSDNEDYYSAVERAGGLDDVHHSNETDSENEETGGSSVNVNTIKPSVTTEEGIEQVKIKLEVDEINEENANKIGGGLKLKIKKEHGQLNSSIIEQQNSSDKRAEKRKKKKKHKEKEKDKQKFSKDAQDEQDVNINNNNTNGSEEHIGASTIRIKVEPPDGSESVAAVLQQRPQPEATIMTSIPMMQFQIACVSSGVEFNNATNPVPESHQTLSSASPDAEPEDVKPNRQELDRIMKISHVSSGIAMETNETDEQVAKYMDYVANYDKGSGAEDGYHEGGNDDDQHADENETDQEEDDQSENPDEEHKDSANENENSDGQSVQHTEYDKKKALPRKIKSVLQTRPEVTTKLKENRLSIAPKSRNKACKSTAKPPNIPAIQISAVQSGVSLEPSTPTSSEITTIFIKPEPQNRGYSDEQPAITSPMRLPQPEEVEETEDLSHAHTEEEQNYISTIDFNNIMIKQEKDIEIDDVQIIQKSIKSIAKLNGIKKKRKQVKDKHLEQNERLDNNDEYMEDEENPSEEADEESDSDRTEDEEEEEEDEEDGEMDEEDEHEEREYRELEYPPEFPDNKHDQGTEEENRSDNQSTDLLGEKEDPAVPVTSKEKEDQVSFTIANVCSEEGVTSEEILDCKDTDMLTPSNISAKSDSEMKQSSQQKAVSESSQLIRSKKTDTTTSSREELLFNTNVVDMNPNTEVPNIVGLQTAFEGEIKSDENTHAVAPVTSDSLKYTTHSPDEQSLNAAAQSQQTVDLILQDIMSREPGKSAEDIECDQGTKNHQEKLQHSTSDIHASNNQYSLQNTAKHSQEMNLQSHGSLENFLLNCEDHLQRHQQQPLPAPLQAVFKRTPERSTDFSNAVSAVGSGLQSNSYSCGISKDNQENVDDASIEGIVQQPKDAALEARPVTEPFDNESVDNDDNDNDYNVDDEEADQLATEAGSTLVNNLEERQNDQNQEVLSQIRPTALALHPYLEDISSSSNSLLSNSLSQTPPPPPLELPASVTGVNNNFNSQRLLDTEETENILNESSEVAETLAMSASHPLTQPILGQPLPPQMPAFNFDNINEIAENNNNANIEREQLQDEQHQQEN